MTRTRPLQTVAEARTVNATAWTGRHSHADDFNIRIVPPRAVIRFCRKHVPWMILPAFLWFSGYRMEWDCRGWFISVGFRCWAPEGEMPELLGDAGIYRSKTGWLDFEREAL